jgi:hypothetical protein
MVFLDVRQPLKITTTMLVLAALTMPSTVFAQPGLETAADRQQQIIDDIEEEQQENGILSKELIGPLASLALFYQEQGDHGPAVAAIERAQQIVRVNYGLYSLEEAPLIRQLMVSEDARGNVEEVHNLEQKLLSLARRHTGDVRTVAIFRESAEKRMDIRRRFLGGEFPPEMCYYTPGERCMSWTRNSAAGAILGDAVRNYLEAIDVLLRNELYSSDELYDLETELIPISYRNGGYSLGRQSLRRLLSYDVVNEEPALTQVLGLVRIADWDLLFTHNGMGLTGYEQAYEILEEIGVPKASIDEIFVPELPIVLPTFLPNPLATREPQSTSYIDVAFEISKYGKGRRIEILRAINVTEAATDRLERLIARSRFRPRSTDGQFGATSVVFRYYPNERVNPN